MSAWCPAPASPSSASTWSASTRTRARSRRSSEGEIPIYEPGLDELVARQRTAGRLTFTTDLAEAVDGADAVFIAVGTPSRRGDGHADLTYVFAAAEEIAGALKRLHAWSSPSRRCRSAPAAKLQRIIREAAAGPARFDVASNPEFLREGCGDRGLHAARPRGDRRRERARRATVHARAATGRST